MQDLVEQSNKKLDGIFYQINQVFNVDKDDSRYFTGSIIMKLLNEIIKLSKECNSYIEGISIKTINKLKPLEQKITNKN